MQAKRACIFQWEIRGSLVFFEGSLSHSSLVLCFSYSLVKRKIGMKSISVQKADFKLVSIIGVPNRS